jgi:hypothetical protein
MSINFIPNDPLAGAAAPAQRVKSKRANRPASRAGFTFSNQAPEGLFIPGTPEFLFWQCREAGLAALQAWEACVGTQKQWQGARTKLLLLQDEGEDINAFYDRDSFSFFHMAIGGKTFFSGVSTDVVAHEVGHGLLDAIRPDLWDAPFLETGAFHEAFGDCVAVLTALNDIETRRKLLKMTKTLRARNFVESTAEELSDGIRRLQATHNAAEPRHAFNNFKFQIPETLPDDGGPGKLINEVHSFGMLFSACFYDLISGIFADQSTKTEAKLLASAKTAGALLVEGARTAPIVARFFQSVGRAMVLADDRMNGGANRARIGAAFQRHNIMLGSNALIAPTAALAGRPPAARGAANLSPATRKDLLERLGAASGSRLAVDRVDMGGRSLLRATHRQQVALGSLDSRLKGVTIAAQVPVIVGVSGAMPAVMGAMPESVSTDREVHRFVESLLNHGQIEFGGGQPRAAMAAGRRTKPVSRETHRVKTVGGKKVLERVRFHCR